MYWLKKSILPVCIVLAWTLISAAEMVNPYLLPSPGKIALLACQMAMDGALWEHIRISLFRVFLGFGITFFMAFPLAVLVGLNKAAYELLEIPLEFIRHIPPLATTPILILWLGIGEASKLAVIVLATFFPIFLNTISGVSQCDKKLTEVGEVLGFTRAQKIFRIILPAALPVIIVGMRLGLGYSFRALIGAELLAASAGLGYMIIEAEELARPDIVLVGIISIGILGHFLDSVFFRITGFLIPWHTQENGHVRA